MLGNEDWPELPRQLAVATARLAALRAERDMLQEQKVELKEQIAQAHRLLEIRLNTPTTVVQGAQAAQMPAMAEESQGYFGTLGAGAAQNPQAQAPQPNISAGSSHAPAKRVQVIRRRG